MRIDDLAGVVSQAVFDLGEERDQPTLLPANLRNINLRATWESRGVGITRHFTEYIVRRASKLAPNLSNDQPIHQRIYSQCFNPATVRNLG